MSNVFYKEGGLFMITGGRFLSLSAKKTKEVPISAVNIDISLSSITLAQTGDLQINYIYTVKYEEDVGELVIEGIIYDRLDSQEQAKSIVSQFSSDKKSLPQDFLVRVINSINYICSINSPLPLRLIDLAPPILPPQLQLNPEEVVATNEPIQP